MASLLKQLASPLDGLHPDLKTMYEKSRKYGDLRPELSTLVKHFETCSKQFSMVVVMLDAFDECDAQQHPDILSLVQQFCDSGIKVYITTRPHLLDHLKEEFQWASILKISARNDDVQKYLTWQLGRRKKRVSGDLKEKITQTISGGAHGMYVPLSSGYLTY